MARRTSPQRIEEISIYLDQYPGSNAHEIAQALGLAPSSVTRALPALEEDGIMLSEDNRGRLWPFGKRR